MLAPADGRLLAEIPSTLATPGGVLNSKRYGRTILTAAESRCGRLRRRPFAADRSPIPTLPPKRAGEPVTGSVVMTGEAVPAVQPPETLYLRGAGVTLPGQPA